MSERTYQDSEKDRLTLAPPDQVRDHGVPGEPGASESGGPDPGLWARSVEFMRRHFVVPLIVSEHPPWFDARGAAVGFFIALGMPLGSHMLIMGALRLVFRFNFLIAFAFSWIINPFTILPIYYADYMLGSLLLSQTEVLSASGFENQLGPIVHSKHFIDSLKAFVLLDLRIMKTWWLGALCVASVSSVPAYCGTYWLQHKRAMKRSV